MRLLFAEIGLEESRRAACERVGPRVNVKAVMLQQPGEGGGAVGPARAPGSTEELRAQLGAAKRRTGTSPSE